MKPAGLDLIQDALPRRVLGIIGEVHSPGGRGCGELDARAMGHLATHPPSISRLVPVVEADRSLAMKATAAATSSALARRPDGMPESAYSRFAGSARKSAVSSVSTKVGAMELTRQPSAASSTAIALVNPSTACLLAQ